MPTIDCEVEKEYYLHNPTLAGDRLKTIWLYVELIFCFRCPKGVDTSVLLVYISYKKTFERMFLEQR
jgi:hypothetical protein